jgi:hypothetical protein
MNARQPDLPKCTPQFVNENIERARSARQAGCGDAVDDSATAEDEIRAMG